MNKKVLEQLSDFLGTIQEGYKFYAGYPGNLSYDYSPLIKFFNHHLINLGDSFGEPNCALNSLKFEQKVLAFIANLYKISEGDYSGYLTSGSTEGNLYGLFLSRELYPNGILYFSQDSHYSVSKAAKLLRVKCLIIHSQETGEMNYEHFEQMLRKNSNYPAIINLNIGTTMKGAIDNLDLVQDILKKNKFPNYYIHCDAALSGMMLPFISDAPQVNFTKSMESVCIYGHKFIGSPQPFGVVLTRKKNVEKVQNYIEYVGSKDTTILGSRNGHSALFFWYAIKTRGQEEFSREVDTCLNNAKYLFNQLKLMSYPCMLNNFSNTVVFKKPPSHLVQKWQLATEGDLAHIVVMQSIDRKKIDMFIDELKECGNRSGGYL